MAFICGNYIELAQSGTPDTQNVEEAFTRASEWLHGKGGFSSDMMREKPVLDLIEETAAVLKKAVVYGLGESKTDTLLSRNLRENVYVFSGFKSFHEMKEAANLLVDENGDRKPFKAFLNDVQKINSTYNKQYLKVEYDFTTASAQMAAKWDELAEDEERYYLQYRTMGDEKVRKAHVGMEGVTLPASDPFWNSYYPPNGFGCRCTVSKVRRAKYGESDSQTAMNAGSKATAGKYAEMFRFNPGKQQAAYPAYNSYTIKSCTTCNKNGFNLARIPKNELCQACPVIREIAKVKEGLKEQRTQLKVWAKENLVGKTVLVNGIQNPVEFTANGIKETLNQPHKTILAKNESLKNIVELLKDGVHVKECPDEKGNPMVHKYHYVKIKIADNDSFAIIRELKDGKAQFYTIVEKIKE